MKKIISYNLLTFLAPLVTFAAQKSFSGFVNGIVDVIKSVIPVLISFALLGFFWGIAKFILHAGGGREQEEAKNTMLWGVIALFVMVSVWGIVAFLRASFL